MSSLQIVLPMQDVQPHPHPPQELSQLDTPPLSQEMDTLRAILARLEEASLESPSISVEPNQRNSSTFRTFSSARLLTAM